MFRFLILLLLVFQLPYVKAQSLPKLNTCKTIDDKTIPLDKVYSLVLITQAGCDYSNDAIISVQELADEDNLNIVVYEYGDLSTIRFLHQEYFNTLAFVHAKTCNLYDEDFFPVVLLYKNKELIWRKEGWKERYFKKVLNQID